MAVVMLMPYMTSADDLVQLKVPALLSGRKRASRVHGIAEGQESADSFLPVERDRCQARPYGAPIYSQKSLLQVHAQGSWPEWRVYCRPEPFAVLHCPTALYRAVTAQVYYRRRPALRQATCTYVSNQTNKQERCQAVMPVQTGPRVIVAIRLERPRMLISTTLITGFRQASMCVQCRVYVAGSVIAQQVHMSRDGSPAQLHCGGRQRLKINGPLAG
jgi:hypothetical protein